MMIDWETKAKTIMKIGVTVAALVICSVLIFGNYSEDQAKWAFGTVGIVMGYWLK